MAKGGKSEERNIFATNRKARGDYTILETYEVGIQLKGTEIKSIRQRHVTLDDSFARIEEAELFLYNMYIKPYAQGGLDNVDPVRPRKLLLHRRQIDRLEGWFAQKRLALIPLRLYEEHGLAKIELAVGQGKRAYEKRDKIRRREVDRDLRRMEKDRHHRAE